MQPINPIERKPAKRTPRTGAARASGTWRDGAVALLAWLMGLGIVGGCGFLFYGFVDTDKGVLTLLSSFVLCFGVGAAGYVPAFWTARTAQRARRGIARQGDFTVILILMLPWIGLAGFVMTGRTGVPPRLGAAALLPVLIFALWALRGLSRTAKTRPPSQP